MQFKKNLFDFTFFTLFQYLIFALILIFIYEGGNPVNPDETSFVWDLNFLSDLGRTHYFNGAPNPFWIFYNLSLSIIGIGIFLYFYFLSIIVTHKVIKKLVILFGSLAGIGYSLISFFPADLYFKQHIQSGMFGFINFIIAILLIILFINKSKYRQIYNLLLSLLILLTVRLIVIYWAKHTGVDKISMLKIHTISQKLVVLPQIIISIIVFIKLKKHIT